MSLGLTLGIKTPKLVYLGFFCYELKLRPEFVCKSVIEEHDLRLSVVIPVLDEEDAIEAVLDRFFEASKRILNETTVTGFELIVVDDNSEDSSLQRLIDYSEKQEMRIIASRKRLGYGGALKRGFKEATGELIAFYDMDFTYDSHDLVNHK